MSTWQAFVDAAGGIQSLLVLAGIAIGLLAILFVWVRSAFRWHRQGGNRAVKIDQLVRQNTDLQHRLSEIANRLEKMERGPDLSGQAVAKAINRAVAQLADEREPHKDVALKSQVAKRMGWKIPKDMKGDQRDAHGDLRLHDARQNELMKSAEDLVRLLDEQQRKTREVIAIAEAIAPEGGGGGKAVGAKVVDASGGDKARTVPVVGPLKEG